MAAVLPGAARIRMVLHYQQTFLARPITARDMVAGLSHVNA